MQIVRELTTVKRGMEEHYGHNVFVTGQSRHDIVGSLPLELVVHVVEYLDQADIIRSQRVRYCPAFRDDLLSEQRYVLGLEAMAVGFVEQYPHQECSMSNACGSGSGSHECQEYQPNDLHSMATWLGVCSPG